MNQHSQAYNNSQQRALATTLLSMHLKSLQVLELVLSKPLGNETLEYIEKSKNNAKNDVS